MTRRLRAAYGQVLEMHGQGILWEDLCLRKEVSADPARRL